MVTKTNNRMIDGAAVNVRDFGAVGDGVTDDTAAIQAANAVAVATSNRLYFPVGVYLSDSLELTGDLHMIGILLGKVTGTKPTFAALQADDASGRETAALAYWLTTITFSSDVIGDANFGSVLFGTNPRVTGKLYALNSGSLNTQFKAERGTLEVPEFVSINSTGVGLHAHYGGTVLADGCVVVGSANRGLYVQHTGHISAPNAQLGTIGDDAVAILYGGSVNMTGASIAAAVGHGLVINYGGSISAGGIAIDSTVQSAITSESGGAIFADGCAISNVTANEGITTAFGGVVNAKNSTIDGTASFAAYAIGGGFINLKGTVISGSVNSGGAAVRSIGNGIIIWEDPATTGMSAERYDPRWNNHGNGNAIITTNDDSGDAGFEAINLFGEGTEKALVGGVLTLESQSMVHVDTENNSATDDLITLAGGRAGQILVIRTINSGREVTVLETGNIRLSSEGDFVLSHENDTLTLYCSGNNWIELSRSNNN